MPSELSTKNQKQCWVPLWNGLIIDQEGKHYQKMGNALWLFLYLALNADEKGGILKRRIKTISVEMGIARGTILRWLNVLREKGYISTENTGRDLLIRISKWKTATDDEKMGHLKYQIYNIRGSKNVTSEVSNLNQSPSDLSSKTGNLSKPNDTFNNIINNVNNVAYNGFRPRTEAEAIALDIARQLRDERNLGLYISYARKYPKETLLSIFSQVKAMPLNRIRKNKGALFTYLVKHYGQK